MVIIKVSNMLQYLCQQNDQCIKYKTDCIQLWLHIVNSFKHNKYKIWKWFFHIGRENDVHFTTYI